MRKLLTLALVLTLILILSMTGLAQKTFIDIATGGTGGTYYPIGGALAQLLSDNVENLSATGQTSNASITNINYLLKGQAETAICQSNVAYWAHNGEVLFEDEEPFEGLRAIASLYPETIHIIAQADAGIDSVGDLKGKDVSVGAPNSGIIADAEIYLPAHGVTFDDLGTTERLSMAETAQAFADYQIDAYVFTTGYPSSSVIDAATKRDIKLIPMDEDVMDQLVEENPYYAKDVIPAGIYKGVEEDVATLATPCWWICTEDLDEDLVYEMTKAMWENNEILADAHSQGKNITLETALDGQPVPLHPGAEKYYKEVELLE
ncbi:MAG: TAXI family TRAP transporter solute-binding subunit [Atribacterota bacterium]